MSYTFQEHVDDLFEVAVGAMGFSTASFYLSEPREIQLAIEGYRRNKREDFYLSSIAMKNAIGSFFGGKKFKEADPFNTEKKEVEAVTPERKAATFEYLQNKFDRKEGEDN